MLTRLCLLLASICPPGLLVAGGYSQGPIIGVLTSPSSKHIGLDTLPKSYVDWVQAAGAHVMPLPSGVRWNTLSKDWTIEQSDVWTSDEYEKRFQLISGLLLPGGDPWPMVSSLAVRQLLNLSRAANAHGDYFPVFGICAGFETLAVLGSGDTCQEKVMNGQIPSETCTGPLTYGWESSNQSLPQKLQSNGSFLTRESTGRLFASAEDSLLKAMESKPIAANFHKAAIAPGAFEANAELVKTFRMLTSSSDSRGQAFVAAMEGLTLPWYGTQWHPEKPAGEWGMKNGAPYEAINHGPEAIRLGQYMANFFVAEASRNPHRAAETLSGVMPMLIVNDVPRPYDPNHPIYMQTYSFNWTERDAGVSPRGEAVLAMI